MDKMNYVVKSESVSSYFSCYTNENEKSFPGEQTKTITKTKSRVLVCYDRDGTKHGSSNEHTRKLNSYKNYNQSTFETTLCLLQPRRSSAKHMLRTTSSSDTFCEGRPSVRYIKQTSRLHTHGMDEERIIDRFRRLSNGEVTMKQTIPTERKSLPQRAGLKNIHFKKGETSAE